jgi:hypothetical protein
MFIFLLVVIIYYYCTIYYLWNGWRRKYVKMKDMARVVWRQQLFAYKGFQSYIVTDLIVLSKPFLKNEV